MKEIDWSKAPEESMYALSTGPKWDGSKSLIGDVRYAIKSSGNYVEIGDESGSTFCMGKKSWIVIAERPNAWTGEGLPPVGTMCEYYADEETWRRCEIVAHKDGKAVVWANHVHIWSSSGAGLRPIRTPEQIAAEEREKAIDDIAEIIGSLWSSEREAAEFLYKAGYRKTEIK